MPTWLLQVFWPVLKGQAAVSTGTVTVALTIPVQGLAEAVKHALCADASTAGGQEPCPFPQVLAKMHFAGREVQKAEH